MPAIIELIQKPSGLSRRKRDFCSPTNVNLSIVSWNMIAIAQSPAKRTRLASPSTCKATDVPDTPSADSAGHSFDSTEQSAASMCEEPSRCADRLPYSSLDGSTIRACDRMPLSGMAASPEPSALELKPFCFECLTRNGPAQA